MKKRRSRYAMTPEKILRWSEEDRGQGTGANHRPWLTVHDVPSRGLRIRLWGHKTGRVHHVLSLLEYRNLLATINHPDVTDVWEQYARSLELTLSIAKRLGYRHPTDNRTGTPVVVTTDLVSTWKSGPYRLVAQHVKPSAETQQKRNQEKAEIERESWSDSPATLFQIVTEKDMPDSFVGNMRWLNMAFRTEFLKGVEGAVPDVEATLRPLVEKQAGPLWELAAYCDRARKLLEPGTSLAIVKYLLAHQWWETNLNNPLDPHKALEVTRFAYAR